MNYALTPTVPLPGKPQPLDLPLRPYWAVRPGVVFHCAHTGCRCVYRGHELTPGQRWAGDRSWFAPCGHEQVSHQPRTRNAEVTL